jgi:DNA repair protein RecO (recombination protein O)
LKNERAIILRTIKQGESNLIVHALNRDGCRVNLMAKGAMRSRRRFGGGVLEPLNYIQMSYRERYSPDDQDALHWLEEAHLVECFNGIRADYDRLEMGIYLLQLVSKVSKEAISDNCELFDLLGNSLHALQSSQKTKYLKLLFELKLLHQQGVLDRQGEGAFLIAFSIRDHEQINLNEDEFLLVKRETRHFLEAYFQ